MIPSPRSHVLRVLGLHRAAVSGENTCVAHGAQKNRKSRRYMRVLENRALAGLVAICTEIMRRFAIAHRSLKLLDEAAVKGRYQLVALLLCFPIFHASNLAF